MKLHQALACRCDGMMFLRICRSLNLRNFPIISKVMMFLVASMAPTTSRAVVVEGVLDITGLRNIVIRGYDVKLISAMSLNVPLIFLLRNSDVMLQAVHYSYKMNLVWGV
ncbi:hypothetical protein KC19_5G051600 [Ceratodon purpureus]|uniref:Uncharacterized protein n=1 Tax=Ceratodon purpureus TaxID=3225 RepID=A0A8T0HZJ7_CERPU|nr:hypothetical protein KC19_5G051600 [Ceratodon purpureus]